VDTRSHWENVYASKAPDAVSWYRPHLETSLELIVNVAPSDASVIDVGGGESTLVDDLLAKHYLGISVLDVSATAIEVTKRRLGALADSVQWLVGDITNIDLPPCSYDVWHDRAVFHFLRTNVQRLAYVGQVVKSVKPGGHVLVSTFGPEGPTKCSGLEVMRYDPESLHAQFGVQFKLLQSMKEMHQTPFGTTQQFVYCLCRIG
jgi:SAM-dependent methyltransferase